jgi:hypothetical protein
MIYDIAERKATLEEAIRIAKVYDKTLNVQTMNVITNYISSLFNLDTEIVDELMLKSRE